MVYEKLTGRYVWPRCAAQGSKEICLFHVDSPNDCKVYEKHRLRSDQYWLDPVGSRLPQATAMPLVSRQVRDEFTKVLWEYTYKHFNCIYDFEFHGIRLEMPTLEFCRRISFGLKTAQYLKLVGFNWHDYDIDQDWKLEENEEGAKIKAITEIKTLEYLNLHFRVSLPRLYYDHPWDDLFDTESAMNACQRILVDWILTGALKHMERVPKITLSGHVKHSTRRKWEAIFENERKGIKHDMREPMARILSPPPAQL